MIVINRWFNKLLFTLFVVFISNSAVAEWIFITNSKFFDGTSLYVDYATIRKKGRTVKMWSLLDFRNKQKLPSGDNFLSVKTQDEYDCEEEQNRELYNLALSENMGLGQAVHIVDAPSFKWQPIVPESHGETLWKIACNKHGLGHNSPSAKAEWLKVQVFKSGDTLYFDPTTIYKDGQFRQVWQLLDLKHKEPRYGAQSMEVKIEYDCKEERQRGLEMIYHSGSMRSGQIITSSKGIDKWRSFDTGTGPDTMLDIVCDKRG